MPVKESKKVGREVGGGGECCYEHLITFQMSLNCQVMEGFKINVN